MSGRGSSGQGGRGAGRGFGGRSQSRRRYNDRFKSKSGSSHNNNRRDEDKFAPHQVGKQPTATYDAVRDKILQYREKQYSHGANLADSIRNDE